MDRKLLAEFRNPGSAYRGAPFWAWNGKLEPEELRWQIRVLRRMGLGGFFMHSRVGLDTGYLSDEWFRCVDACVDEARKLGMYAWLYDEDRWPSGAAGGLVTRNPKYRQRGLVMDVLSRPADLRWTGHTLAAFTARIQGTAATGVRRLARGSRPARLSGEERILAFHAETADCSSWYNGYTYLDTLSREAVREFIRVTHEAYRRHCGASFGREIPGIFTDEPNHHFHRYGGGRRYLAAWTGRLPAVFRARYGYELASRLPELFFDVEGNPISKTRRDYHDCITHLFVEAFARQIGRWCDRHGLLHTGHVLAEESLSSQTHVVGSCMRFYEYMQAPGMDILTEYNREYDTAKQVSSMARQFGRKWRLTETYGCTGWDFPFEGHKAIGDWQAALGINLRCQHLAWYTMGGEAKRDYPAGIFYHSPWWDVYAGVEDYFARIHAVMTRGEEVRRLLVIHPIESLWAVYRRDGAGRPEAGALEESFIRVRDSLLQANLDFDYGDEDILARHGRVGRASGLPALRVARAAYRAVVVPPVLTLRQTTLDLLRRFREAGGAVVFAGAPPRHVEAVPDDGARSLAASCARAPAWGGGLARALEQHGRVVSIEDERGRQVPSCLHLLREDGDAFYLFLCNTSLARAQQQPHMDQPGVRGRRAAYPAVTVRLHAQCAGAPLELDPASGETFAARARRTSAGWELATALPRLASRLFVFPKAARPRRYPPRRLLTVRRRRGLGRAGWAPCLSEDNVFVLDRPAFRIGTGPWHRPTEILRVDNAVRAALGVPPRGGRMVQPWARERKAQARSVEVVLRYVFKAAEVPSGELVMAIERPETFSLRVNGTAVSQETESGWWCDKALRRIPIDPALLRVGANEIALTCRYDENHSGLELVYLLGSFGVAVRGAEAVMTRAPKRLRVGDWVKQGLAFYAGHVTYEKTIRPRLRKGERLFVRAPEYRGIALRVLVNGRVAGLAPWEPNEVEITPFLNGGAVRLGIQVLGHRRNSHGPLHHRPKWPRWTGPDEFKSRGRKWADGYQLVPCGLMREPELVVKR